ncbi:MAG: glycosyltransferase family 9 protein [Bacteroidota bacterium]
MMIQTLNGRLGDLDTIRFESNMILKTDCIKFPGDRPCIPNKTRGIMCDNCNEYEPAGFKILIIKLDAPGDVLRTTSILPSLKEKYPSSHISWLTRAGARDLFRNNPYINYLMTYEDPATLARLHTEHFSLLIHPDASPVSAAFAAVVNADEKRGFTLNSLGRVVPFTPEAEEWLQMGAFDQLKKKNTKSYQQILHEIAGLEYKNSPILLFLDDNEKKFRDSFYEKHQLGRFKKIIGLNTGASRRWQLKKWRLDGFIELIDRLLQDSDTGILLYGGPEEEERNRIIREKFPCVIDTGAGNTLREFFALLDLSDIIVTGDTMALHAATALKKKIVCTFGPTSQNEIEDYGQIRKVAPDMECLVCYKPECDFVPNCMDLISVDMVYSAIMNFEL